MFSKFCFFGYLENDIPQFFAAQWHCHHVHVGGWQRGHSYGFYSLYSYPATLLKSKSDSGNGKIFDVHDEAGIVTTSLDRTWLRGSVRIVCMNA